MRFPTLKDARTRVRRMPTGVSFRYYRGYLLLDRRDNPALAALANFFLQAGTEEGWGYGEQVASPNGLGLGFLTQRKLGDRDYEYLFTKL